TSSGEGVAQLWDPATGQRTQKRPLKSWARSVDFSPDGKTLLTVSGNTDLQQWEVASGHALRCITKPESWLQCMTYSRDGSSLAAVDMHKDVHFWDSSTGKELDYPVGQMNTHQDEPESDDQQVTRGGFRPQMVLTPDGKMVITSRLEPIVQIWEMASG